ncbi:MAG: glycosyltransferase family 4 protein [Bacteriovoracaceae bacterium]|jgi:glycosyltransferase involved in cell wall biosynthesis|nr:glycosyltransferase family 4 protein [Bacteriovoracaceae bacterium]
MRITVTVENRFFRDQNSQVWTENHFPYEFWDRYLKVYKNVRVVARAQDVSEIKPHWKRVDGDKVSVFCLPFYIGPIGYLKNFFKMRKLCKELVVAEDRYLMRVGSPIADIIQPILLKRKIPYAVEVVGDPWDVFGPGVFHHPLRPLLRLYFTYKLKKQCAHAACASYVTQKILQQRYPVKQGRFSIGASSIVLKDEDIVSHSRTYEKMHKISIINIGSLEYHVKGTDTLIKAVAILANKGINISLSILGDGRFRADYEKMAQNLGVKENIDFCGNVPAGKLVQNKIDSSDIFILPSRSEGLPRAMIEAMARGVFCLGTKAGGINELLEEDQKVEVGDFEDLAKKIEFYMNNPDLMNKEAKRNLEFSKGYHYKILEDRRTSLYKHLRNL